MMTWFFRLCAAAFAFAIIVLSLEPVSHTSSLTHADKVLHFLAYGALAGLMIFGWPKLRAWHVVLIATIFGICVEMAQGMTNLGRTPSILDAVANWAGALTIGIILQLLGQTGKKEKN